METKGDAQAPRDRRMNWVWAALLASCIWGAIGAGVWHASRTGSPVDGALMAASSHPAIVTFQPRSAEELARVLDEAWEEVGVDGEVPGIAPLALPADMAELDAGRRKRTFLRAIVPHLLAVNRGIASDRRNVERVAERVRGGTAIPERDLAFLRDVCRRYRLPEAEERLADGDDSGALRLLLDRVDVVPVRLALAQAAVESGWGASRLAREDNGIFGQCAVEGGQDAPARPAPNGLWYARFQNLREAVDAYVRNLNTFWAYEDFRRIRGEMRKKGAPLDAARLATGLLPYSELGEWYVDKIRAVIRSRDIDAFKQAKLATTDPTRPSAGFGRGIPALALGGPDAGPDA